MKTTLEYIEELHQRTLVEMDSMYTEYSLDLPVEQRLLDKATKILDSQGLEAARVASRKAIEATHLHVITKGTKKSPEWYEKQARKAESRAKSMNRKGETALAEKQTAYAKQCEEKAAQLRQQK